MTIGAAYRTLGKLPAKTSLRRLHSTSIKRTLLMAVGSVRCVVFDLDDTLWGATDALDNAHNKMIARLEELDPAGAEKCRDRIVFLDEMRKLKGEHPDRQHDFNFLRTMATTRIVGNEEVAKEAFAAWLAARNSPELFAGAVDALKRLKQRGLLIGTLTDGNADAAKVPGLGEVLDFTVNAVEAGAPKPEPPAFALCQSKAGCQPSEMVMVGDSAEKDVAGAKTAGWRAIWVRPPERGVAGSIYDVSDGKQGHHGSESADAVVDHVSEVEGLLDRWAA
mmetsp:Transcript_8975/g.16173  ORF Transcript_8975/g.16173 Transcript_8975/m.16173 type:complete len:278 (-) Transcript_8975:45-878(-)